MTRDGVFGIEDEVHFGGDFVVHNLLRIVREDVDAKFLETGGREIKSWVSVRILFSLSGRVRVMTRSPRRGKTEEMQTHDNVIGVELKDVRLCRFGREAFAVDKGAVRRLDVFDKDLFSGASAYRQSIVGDSSTLEEHFEGLTFPSSDQTSACARLSTLLSK